MSWHLQNQVCANADQGVYKSATQFAVMRALASFADNDGERCFPSLAALATRSQCNERTVKRVLKKFRRNNWIAVTRTGRSNQYRILEHRCVAPPEREVMVSYQIGQAVPSDGTQSPIRGDTESHYSYQGLSSETTHQEPPPKPPKGVVVVFDFEEEEATKEKTLKDAPPLRADQSTRHSFVTPLLGENPSGFAPRFPSATRGGLEDGCSAPDAAPDILERLQALARERGLPQSDAEAVHDDWLKDHQLRDAESLFEYRHKKGWLPSQLKVSLEVAREAARKARWERYQ